MKNKIMEINIAFHNYWKFNWNFNLRNRSKRDGDDRNQRQLVLQ